MNHHVFWLVTVSGDRRLVRIMFSSKQRVSVASLIVEVESFPNTPNSSSEVTNGKILHKIQPGRNVTTQMASHQMEL